MPEKSPFHPRTSALCESLRWKDWAGYHAVASYRECHEMEYYAFRDAAGLLDVTPLFKYEVRGPDAAAVLARVMTRDVSKLRVGRVTYTCWCDGAGKVVDDGTVTRLEEDHFRVTSADPSLAWFQRHARGFDVQMEESTQRIAALAIQGPRSRDILSEVVDIDLSKLGFFRAKKARLDGVDVLVSRTGYTGDLGFEVWIDADKACAVYDSIMGVGSRHGLLPVGLDALDMARVEAGFVLNGVDYYSSRHCVIESRKSTPLELGLEWTVHLDREPFIGQAAMKAEAERGPAWRFVGLDINWDELETLWERHHLAPQISGSAWRTAVPVYADAGGRKQVGYASSGTFSPILKKNLAMAHIRAPYGDLGTQLHIEATVEFERKTVPATIVPRPFFDPPRKTATPGIKKKKKKKVAQAAEPTQEAAP